jgi:glycosyltransferase involved in cell wall biosynthesis
MCTYLQNKGCNVLLVGRKLKSSLPIDRKYRTKRLKLLFTKGPLFYGFFNLRLFFYLLFSKFEIVVSNDLDTLWACSKASRIKKKILIYDSHEIFTEVPELKDAELKKKIWEKIEKKNVYKAKQFITVNQSIANWYAHKYKMEIDVVRNMPFKNSIPNYIRPEELQKEIKYIIVQGAGINIDRGNEAMVEAMKLLPHYFHLLIIGSGDVISYLKTFAKIHSIENRIHFYDKMPFERLMNYTKSSWLGITLDKDTNLNYKYSLPNKLFDFIQAGCPVLATNLPEISSVIKKYNVGITVDYPAPKLIADTIISLHNDTKKYELLKANTSIAASELCWENEIPTLDKIYGPYLLAQR